MRCQRCGQYTDTESEEGSESTSPLPRVQEDTLNNRELLSENDRLGMDLPAYIMVLLVTVRHDVSISSSPT